ncbi:hypothetical protein HOD88_01550 [archaeon]|jgi:hypothetical protein|nr:hypothetical protein [archaeon]
MINWLLFLHFVGIIIALGAVTVIDTMGFFSRKDKKKTQDTISAHHTTKPLIWIGTIIVLVTWIFILFSREIGTIEIIKSILLIIMIFNGAFLSFHISPRLDKLIGKKVLLPNKLQAKIAISLVISFFSWWTFVLLSFA